MTWANVVQGRIPKRDSSNRPCPFVKDSDPVLFCDSSKRRVVVFTLFSRRNLHICCVTFQMMNKESDGLDMRKVKVKVDRVVIKRDATNMKISS